MTAKIIQFPSRKDHNPYAQENSVEGLLRKYIARMKLQRSELEQEEAKAINDHFRELNRRRRDGD
jgi:hypothetical protein